MDDTLTTSALSAHATNNYYIALVSMGCILMAILMAFLIFRKGMTTKDRLVRLGLTGVLLMIAFASPMITSSASVDQCSKAAANPQILKGLRGAQIERVRKGCGEVGVVIGPVQS